MRDRIWSKIGAENDALICTESTNKAHAAGGPQKGYSYRDQWWVSHNEHKAYMALGIYGQAIYIDPTANMVIVNQSSQPSAQLDFADQNEPLVYHALAKHLMDQD